MLRDTQLAAPYDFDPDRDPLLAAAAVVADFRAAVTQCRVRIEAGLDLPATSSGNSPRGLLDRRVVLAGELFELF
jgi:hypothetical protein